MGEQIDSPRLNDDDFRTALVEAYVAGATRAEMLTVFSVSAPTLRRWLQDPRVVAEVNEAIQIRANGFVRKIDSEINARLDKHIRHMPLDDLLKIRREITNSHQKRTIEVQGQVDHTHAQIPTAVQVWGQIDAEVVDGDVEEVADGVPALERPAEAPERDASDQDGPGSGTGDSAEDRAGDNA